MNNIDEKILCDNSYYDENKKEFTEIKWGENIEINNYNDIKFKDLKLKSKYQKEVDNITEKFKDYDTVAVHIRQSDYRYWNDGKYFFEYKEYLNICKEKIKEWNIEKYKILIFSDEKQQTTDKDIIIVGDLTDYVAPIDMHIMADCNYFICTWSTFSSLARHISESAGKFKKCFILE